MSCRIASRRPLQLCLALTPKEPSWVVRDGTAECQFMPLMPGADASEANKLNMVCCQEGAAFNGEESCGMSHLMLKIRTPHSAPRVLLESSSTPKSFVQWVYDMLESLPGPPSLQGLALRQSPGQGDVRGLEACKALYRPDWMSTTEPCVRLNCRSLEGVGSTCLARFSLMWTSSE